LGGILKEFNMIHISPNHLQTKVVAIQFTLRHFVLQRQSILQTMMTGKIDGIGFSSGLWHSETENDLTFMQARISPIHVQQGDISALRKAIFEQSNLAVDEFTRACHRECELVDVQVLVELPDGSTKLLPKSDLIHA
jgi:hypothetical protein